MRSLDSSISGSIRAIVMKKLLEDFGKIESLRTESTEPSASKIIGNRPKIVQMVNKDEGGMVLKTEIDPLTGREVMLAIRTLTCVK